MQMALWRIHRQTPLMMLEQPLKLIDRALVAVALENSKKEMLDKYP